MSLRNRKIQILGQCFTSTTASPQPPVLSVGCWHMAPAAALRRGVGVICKSDAGFMAAVSI